MAGADHAEGVASRAAAAPDVAADQEVGRALRHAIERARRVGAFLERRESPTYVDPGSAFWIEYVQLKAAIHHLDDLRLHQARRRRGAAGG